MDKDFFEIARRATSGGTTIRPGTGVPESSRVRGSALQTRDREDASRVHLRLVDDDGWLQWEESNGLPFELQGFRSGSATATAGDFDVLEMEFDRLPPSKITQFLSGQDERLTPARGLRRLNPQTRRLEEAAFPDNGRALIFLHGTFSNSENMIAGLLKRLAADDGGSGGDLTDNDDCFLSEAVRRYDGNLFTFDHPTLSVGPLLNAVDLQRAVEASSAKIDLIGHSRGGLVARWWCETFDSDGDRCEKVVFVGTPLAGTSLAAPPNIRHTIQWLTSVSRAVQLTTGAVGMAVPIFKVVETLLKVLTSLTRLATKTPAADAAMAMVPGLFAMSRVGNNPELQRLLEGNGQANDRYHAIETDFQPASPGWKFWHLLRREHIANAGADLLFGGANDLMVDTASMTTLADQLRIVDGRRLDFGRSATVHHLNYFDQPETSRFLGDLLL